MAEFLGPYSHPLGLIGDERSVIEQAQLGAIDIARVSSSPVGEFFRPMGVFDLPYIFRDQDHFVNVLQGPIGEELLTGLEGADLIGLAFYDAGSRNFYTTETPIRSVEDLQGLRLRTQQSEVVLDLMENPYLWLLGRSTARYKQVLLTVRRTTILLMALTERGTLKLRRTLPKTPTRGYPS